MKRLSVIMSNYNKLASGVEPQAGILRAIIAEISAFFLSMLKNPEQFLKKITQLP